MGLLRKIVSKANQVAETPWIITKNVINGINSQFAVGTTWISDGISNNARQQPNLQ